MQISDPVIFIMGPTASGKTALALALASQLPCEIISVDSALVYRHMDIGTAKPSPAELASCPHHLIDIISPLQSYSAAEFCQQSRTLIEAIRQRGRIPLLVGGTLLYYKALMQGLSDLPQADPELRRKLDQQALQHGWPALHSQLAQLDPVTAARLKPTDAQRIQRALEVCLLSGQPLSTLITQKNPSPARWQSLKLALVPAERSWLHQRIGQRFDRMLKAGLLDELTQLRQRYPTLSAELPSMRSVGYRQAWEYQQGMASYQQMQERGLAATRQLAKRQLTWIRSLDLLPLNAQAEDIGSRVRQLCDAFLAGAPLPQQLLHTGDY